LTIDGSQHLGYYTESLIVGINSLIHILFLTSYLQAHRC
jgi:hypothetical protein